MNLIRYLVKLVGDALSQDKEPATGIKILDPVVRNNRQHRRAVAAGAHDHREDAKSAKRKSRKELKRKRKLGRR